MTIAIKAYANADDVLIAWQPGTWSDDWAGFQPARWFSPRLAGSPLYRFTGASRRAASCITVSTSAGSTPFLSAASASRACVYRKPYPGFIV